MPGPPPIKPQAPGPQPNKKRGPGTGVPPPILPNRQEHSPTQNSPRGHPRHPHLKARSATIAAPRASLEISPHLAWISNKNFSFFIFQCFTEKFEFYNLKSYRILTYPRLPESNGTSEQHTKINNTQKYFINLSGLILLILFSFLLYFFFLTLNP